ncbi:hypothetical protein SmJEL517_g00423 [Synchytrium microbalum]|uniref:STAS domain-containing protein n=1 Tax=Synchytrium microbalum TaxID=1806994 RepID=A0A507CFP5_9FUNG|nr:uncharacterized protein SmJEL517_g00423 [Synchytrium microbalum]TPX37999.1 hypothetical protein SmJEL517_g00423 [Synchytrium microbalum]
MSEPKLEQYNEKLPTLYDGLKSFTSFDDASSVSDKSSKSTATKVLQSYFPFLDWLPRYNLTWFIGDLVAGLTIGAVVVPQAMSYAKLANLAPQFGLYSAFVGVLMYFFFATSKDITIGPVAVLSQLVGSIILQVAATNPQYSAITVAAALSITGGLIVFAMGVLRLGFLVDFIPLPAISAFVTGAALNIGMGQFPALVGISSLFDTRAATYQVFINFFKFLPNATLDSALGVSALVMLYLIRGICGFIGRRYPRYERTTFFISTLRSVFVILLYTMISYLLNRGLTKPRTSILGTVPSGLQNVGVPAIDSNLLSVVAPFLPSVVIVMLIEHIAIAKAFARINQYTINPSQELIAIAVTNIFGPFFGAYPATGSFSRTAIKAKAGVRTPLAGVITGAVVILAIYLLPPMFYWISNAALAAIIIHAVGDLITAPKVLIEIWKVDPIELVVFFVGVVVSVFTTIENGIYASIGAAGAVLLYRMANPKGVFLGRVKTYHISPDTPDEASNTHYVWVPLDHSGSHPEAFIEAPPAGVFVYRLTEGFIYPNASTVLDRLVAYLKANTKTGTAVSTSVGSRPWNDPGPRKGQAVSDKPLLRAVIIDLTGISRVDFTASQALVDVGRALDRYADRHVEFHFVGISSGWIKRALVATNFGGSVVNIPVEGSPSFTVAAQSVEGGDKLVPISDTSRPFFHNNIDDALEAVERVLKQSEQTDAKTDKTLLNV